MIMISMGDPRKTNPVLSVLQIAAEDRIISVRENAEADSNFILTHLIKQILHEKNRVCFVNFHNPIEHYQMVGKKLGYDLLKAVQAKEINILEPINAIVDNIGLDDNYLQEDKENIVKCLYLDIKKRLNELLYNCDQRAYLIVDDLSHLFDLGVEVTEIITFVNYCLNLINNERISVVLNNHVATKIDEIISNHLQYVADVNIEITPLRTGRSHDVTGYLTIERLSRKSEYHFKAFDRGIKTFYPGESIHHWTE